MALQKNIDTLYGIVFNYHKVHITGKSNEKINFDVNVYYDKNARDSGAIPYPESRGYEVKISDTTKDIRSYSELDLIAMCYDYLKTLSDYSDAINC